jgi:hypothetical protein
MFGIAYAEYTEPNNNTPNEAFARGFITIPSNPYPGANYTIQTQGAPFQFSETILGPGVAKETWIERKTYQESVTNSLSVFTQ